MHLSAVSQLELPHYMKWLLQTSCNHAAAIQPLPELQAKPFR